MEDIFDWYYFIVANNGKMHWIGSKENKIHFRFSLVVEEFIDHIFDTDSFFRCSTMISSERQFDKFYEYFSDSFFYLSVYLLTSA